MIEIDIDKRRQSVLLINQERDNKVREVIAKYGATISRGRTPIADRGWDAEYIVEFKGTRFGVVDIATIPLEELEGNLQAQFDAKCR